MSRVVVITGASAGVGRAVARRLAARGDRLGLLARGHDGLEAAAKDVEAGGGFALAVPCDVADADQVDAALAEVEASFGPVDVWINNAMTSVFAFFADVTADEFRRVTDVTYHGYVNGTRAALRSMCTRNEGVIIQVSSALAHRGIPLQSAYCGAKHAIHGFTESVRCELIHRESAVRIATVELPALNTPQFDWALSRLPRQPQPVPPIYQPEVAARAIVAMVDRPRRGAWVGAPTWATIVANRVAPGLLDRYLGRRGVDAQQTAAPTDTDRPSNLWHPVSGDRGAHGRFDARAMRRSVSAWISAHRPSLAGLVRRDRR